MQIYIVCLSSCLNHCLATCYAMDFNIVWLRFLFFMLNIDESKFLLFVYQAIVIENYFLE